MAILHVPLITPFAADGSVDVGALERLAHEILRDGAGGLVALGTTGEPGALDAGEREAVVRVVGRACRARGAHFTVGVTGNDTRTVAAELSGVRADAALVTVPYFTRPSQDGVVAHFERLARASAAPLIVYDIPYRTGLRLSAATVRRIAEIPGVLGFKHSAGGIGQDTVELVRDVPLLAGDDVFAPALFALGAAGGILASAHVVTDRWVGLAESYDAGLGHELSAMAAALFAEPNPVVIKAVLHAQGRIPTPDVRLPLLPASRSALETAVRAVLRAGDTRVGTYARTGEIGATG